MGIWGLSVLTFLAWMGIFVDQGYGVEISLYSDAGYKGNEQLVNVYDCQQSHQLFLGVSSVRIHRGGCVRLCASPSECRPVNQNVVNLESIGLNDIITIICPCNPRKRMGFRKRIVTQRTMGYPLLEDSFQRLA